ncbi:hypothetical protein CF319_g9326 [Tilletia indica]|nr:hypothetical protein CF319_g9326 [Tilletia indica]
MSLDPDLMWLPGQQGKRARCRLCHEGSSSGIKPSDIAFHLKKQCHKDAVSLRDALLDAREISTDDEARSEGPFDEGQHIQQDDDIWDNDFFLPDSCPEPVPGSDPLRTGFDASDVSSESYDDDPDLIDEHELSGLQELGDADFHPFPSRLIFLVHAIASNPRCPMSIPQVRLILQLLKWLGLRQIPSHYAYKRGVDKATRSITADKERTFEVEGREGHQFVTTSIAHELARDFSNPDIRQQLSLYPRRDKSINDLMDAEWVHSLRDQRSPPMAVLPSGRHAFVQEPVELSDYRVFLVSAWYQVEGKVHGWGRICEPSQDDTFFRVVSEREELFAVSSITSNGEEIKQRGYGTGE